MVSVRVPVERLFNDDVEAVVQSAFKLSKKVAKTGQVLNPETVGYELGKLGLARSNTNPRGLSVRALTRQGKRHLHLSFKDGEFSVRYT